MKFRKFIAVFVAGIAVQAGVYIYLDQSCLRDVGFPNRRYDPAGSHGGWYGNERPQLLFL